MPGAVLVHRPLTPIVPIRSTSSTISQGRCQSSLGFKLIPPSVMVVGFGFGVFRCRLFGFLVVTAEEGVAGTSPDVAGRSAVAVLYQPGNSRGRFGVVPVECFTVVDLGEKWVRLGEPHRYCDVEPGESVRLSCSQDKMIFRKLSRELTERPVLADTKPHAAHCEPVIAHEPERGLFVARTFFGARLAESPGFEA